MFLSKIWFFVIAIAAAAAITVAVVMPKPAERASATAERKRLQRACSVVGIVLRSNARSRVQNAASVARGFGLGEVAASANKGDIVSGDDHAAGKAKLTELLKEFEASEIPAPTFVFLIDQKGRVVARTGVDGKSYGDVISGYYAVDDALAGYMRDDIWTYDDNLFRVAVSPVFTNTLQQSGAVVIGYAFDKPFAERIGNDLDVQLSFYSNGKAVASNHPVQIHEDIVANFKENLASADTEKPDCAAVAPFDVTSGGTGYTAIMARLPGEARPTGAFYSVSVAKPSALGFSGTLDAVKKEDLSFSSFPWIKLALAFVLIVAIGLGLLIFEVDLPLRKLGKDAVDLAKSETKERLEEERHRSKYGSIARSVNIHIDKLNREARAAKKEFDQLIGPASDSGVMAVVAPPPSSTPAPPPPSEFKFGGQKATSGAPSAPPSSGDFDLGIPTPPPTGAAGGLDLSSPIPKTPGIAGEDPKTDAVGLLAELSPTPKKAPPPKPPIPTAKPPPAPPKVADQAAMTDQPTTVDAPRPSADANSDDEGYFEKVYADFVALKKRCGENVDNLTLEKFSRKLQKNKDALIAKHNCKSVKFQVYIKDGKAALKASPVKS